MSTPTQAGAARLTLYESEQIEQIAAWKSAPPNAFAELLKKITMPGADLIEKVIPDRLARLVIEKAYEVSEMIAGQDDIKRQAGVPDLDALRQEPLEECDRLAFRVGALAQTWATVEGAATGAGGVFTTLIDIPLLFTLSLRTILKIGHCYGYALDRPNDQSFVLGVLIAATSGSLALKRKRLDQLRELEHLLLEEAQEEILADEALSLLFQLEIFEELPGVGMVSGAVLNLAFIRRVELTARRVFQERWLADNGKIEVIEPDAIHQRHLIPGWRGAMGRAAYSGFYSVGFGVALPVCMIASLFRSIDHSLVQVVDGAPGMTGSPLMSPAGTVSTGAG